MSTMERKNTFVHKVVKELINNGVISLDNVKSEKNLADLFTKGLTRNVIIVDASKWMELIPI